MSRILSPASRVLFILQGCLIALYAYAVSQFANNLQWMALTHWLDVAYYFVPLCGFILLIPQARSQRQWLGWTGIGITLASLTVMGLLFTTFFAFKQLYPWLLAGYIFPFAAPSFALGLIFWAFDLPHVPRSFQVQKAAMGILAILLFFPQVLDIYALTWNRATIFLITELLSALGWIILGISIREWRTRSIDLPSPSKTSPFNDSSIEIVTASIPSSEMENNL